MGYIKKSEAEALAKSIYVKDGIPEVTVTPQMETALKHWNYWDYTHVVGNMRMFTVRGYVLAAGTWPSLATAKRKEHGLGQSIPVPRFLLSDDDKDHKGGYDLENNGKYGEDTN